MKVTKEKLENCQMVLNIEVEAGEREEHLDKAYRRLVNKVFVPGFRKGKAPRFILERHIGKEALLKEAMEKLVPDIYSKAIKENEIAAIAEPDVEVVSLEPVVFKATVAVKPAVELGDYKSIRIPLEPVEIKEETINNYLEGLRERNALRQPIERPVQIGDTVNVDVRAVVGDKDILNEKGLQLNLVEGSTIITAGFSEELVSMSTGDEKEFEIPLPAEYPRKELVGKNCLFKVKINDIKEKKLPELNDDFARSLGEGLDTLEELRSKVASGLQQAVEQLNRRKLEGQVLEAIVASSRVDYSKVLVDREIDHIIDEKVRTSGRSNMERYLEDFKKSKEELREEAGPEAEKRVTNMMVLDKIAEVEKIEVTEEEIDKEIDSLLKVASVKNPQDNQSLSSPPGKESVKSSLRFRKTIQLISDIALSQEVVAGEETVPEQASPQSEEGIDS